MNLSKVGLALGLGVGTAVYDLIRYGFGQIEWTRAVFVFGFSLILLLLVPRRWLSREDSERS